MDRLKDALTRLLERRLARAERERVLAVAPAPRADARLRRDIRVRHFPIPRHRGRVPRGAEPIAGREGPSGPAT